MLQFLSSFNPRKFHINRLVLSSLLNSIASAILLSRTPSHQTSKTYNVIAQFLLSKCALFFDRELLLNISEAKPDIARRFRRILRLKPEDYERVANEVTKVESLWWLFKWASDQDKLCLGAYSHGMLREVQLLHLAMERQGILLDKNEIFSKLIDGYVGAFDLERAMLVYDRIREQGMVPSLFFYHNLIDVLVRRRITQTGISNGGIRKVFRLLCGDGMVQEARNLMKKVMALGFEPSSLIIDDIAFCYCEKNDFEDLASFFCCNEAFTKYVIKKLRAWYGTCSYNALIGTVFREGMWKNAQNILVKMVEKGVAPNLSTYRTLLAGYCKARQFDEVKMMVHKMVNYAVMPNLANQLGDEVLNLLVQAYCKGGLTYKGRIIFNEMLLRDITIENGKYTAPMVGLGKRGNYQDFHSGLQDCKSLVGCLFNHRTLKKALGLLESILVFHPHLRSEICRMLVENQSVTDFTCIARKLPSYRRVMQGEKDTMLARNLVPCLYVSLILILQLCKIDRLDKAVALRQMVIGFCMIGEVGEAANVVQDMLLKELFPDAEIYNMLFQGYCEANCLRKVKELGVLIRKFSSPSISSYQNLVRLIMYHNLIIYKILFFYHFSDGNSLLVDELLNELQEKGLLLDEVAYNFLIYGFSKCKDVSGCLHYLSTMISKGFRPSYRSLRTAVTCLCDLGFYCHGSVVQNAIVEGLFSHDKLREAEYFLDQMIDKGLVPDAINYENLIKRFCFHSEDWSKAVDLLNIMLKKGIVPNSASYDSLIHDLCIKILHRYLKPSIRTLDVLIQKLCQLGQKAGAENFLISMVLLGETPTRLMYSVINGYCVENDPRKASKLLHITQQSGYEPDFEIHWSLISNLQKSKEKDNSNSSQGFLPRLPSGSGHS
ncbi:hypothetical protein P3X46_029740 [Hevea brasiliensis]|uniref:Pentacotripeptide-repeat region of PRORP domain-containing protein n=1 Tax=Hevea brasiliensis TaxID=3981 RepID=A0ABQ9KT98_HEVBR|nr:hypothetical protein P3X46_029740 [Hevea brasiliensis]